MRGWGDGHDDVREREIEVTVGRDHQVLRERKVQVSIEQALESLDVFRHRLIFVVKADGCLPSEAVASLERTK